MIITYVLHPGRIRSKPLDKVINVTASELVDLYHLHGKRTVVAKIGHNYESRNNFIYIHCRPQASGVYKLEAHEETQQT